MRKHSNRDLTVHLSERRPAVAESTCTIVDCDKPVKSRGLCRRHYLIWWRAHRDEIDSFAGMECQEDGCSSPAGARSGYCRSCYFRRYEVENSDRIAARRAKRRPIVRDRETLRAREYRKADPERFREANRKYRENNRDRIKDNQRRYRESERGIIKNRQKGARRRARMREAFVETVDYAAVLAEHGMFCHICSMVIVDASQLHFDHVVPLALGGLHEYSNIRPAHALCNLRKGARSA